MKISIVVPAFNEEKRLPETLRSIQHARQQFHARQWDSELIVCDNNSTDATAAIAREHGAHVVFEPVNQIARARNAGAAAASGDWLIFVDADSRPSPELFAAVAQQIQSGRVIGGGAMVHLDEFHFFAWFGNALWNCISRVFRYAAGSFIFCDAKAFRELGGFSHELYVAEEIDLSQRLKRLAKAKGKKVKIIARPSLPTSARKLGLYSRWEHFTFAWRALRSGGAFKKNREACHIWYDGRR